MGKPRQPRRAVLWIVLVAILALGFRWLVTPRAEDGDEGPSVPTILGGDGVLEAQPRGPQHTPLERLVEWVKAQVGEASKPEKPPPLALLPLQELGPPGVLVVNVKLDDGDGVAGVPVQLLGPAEGTARPVVLTNVSGLVSYEELPSATYLVRVQHQDSPYGYLSAREERLVKVAPGTTTRVEIVAPSQRASGTVRDAHTHEAVAGADITIVLESKSLADTAGDVMRVARRSLFGEDQTTSPRRTRSDAQGRFAFEIPPGWSAEVTATTTDGRAGRERVWRAPGLEPVEILVDALQTCSGTVVSSLGAPLSGVRVRFAEVRTPDDDGVTTGPDGAFSLPYAGGNLNCTLCLDGREIPTFSTVVDVGRPSRIQVPDGATLDVTLEVGVGAPGPDGALIQCSSGERVTEGVTSGGGRARVPVAAGRVRSISLWLPGGGALDLDTRSAGVVVEPVQGWMAPLAHGEVRPLRIRLPQAWVVVGRVVTPDGRAEAGSLAFVSVDGRPVGRAQTDDAGSFRIEPVYAAPGGEGSRAYVLVIAPDGQSAEVPLPWKDARGDTLDVGTIRTSYEEPGAALVARVVDESGAPVSAASFHGDATGTSDEQGIAKLHVGSNSLSENEARLQVRADGFATQELTFDWTLSHGQLRELPPIRLRRARSALVRVLDAEGRAVVGAQVEWSASSEASTDGDGIARLAEPASTSDSLWVRHDHARFTVSRPKPISDARADALRYEVRLPPTRKLTVRVQTPDGHPVQDAEVSVGSAPSADRTVKASGRSTTSDAAGIAVFPQVLLVPLSVTVKAEGFVPASVDVDATQEDVRVTLRPWTAADTRRLQEILDELARLKAPTSAHPDEAQTRKLEDRIDELEAERDSLLGD